MGQTEKQLILSIILYLAKKKPYPCALKMIFWGIGSELSTVAKNIIFWIDLPLLLLPLRRLLRLWQLGTPIILPLLLLLFPERNAKAQERSNVSLFCLLALGIAACAKVFQYLGRRRCCCSPLQKRRRCFENHLRAFAKRRNRTLLAYILHI